MGPTVHGRDAELALLTSLLDGAVAGAGHVAVLTGSAGMGKTTLARAVASEAVDRGLRLGWGVAGARLGAAALAPWVEALADLGKPGLEATLDPEGVPDPGRRTQVFRSVADRIATAGADAPVVIVLEDVHDAADGTLELLGFLARRPFFGRCLILATARADARLASIPTTAVELSGWSVQDVAEVAASSTHDLTDDQVRALHHRTGGNPLFVTRLLQGSDPTRGIPFDVTQLVANDVAALSADARELVRALSILGNEVDLPLATRVAGGPIDDEVEELCQAGLLQRAGSDVRFAHPLSREVVHDRLLEADRGHLHARAAEALAELGADPGRIAHHATRAPSTARGPEVSRLLVLAGDQAMNDGAPGYAAILYDEACTGLDDHDAERLEVGLRSARAHSHHGDIAGGQARVDDAIDRATSTVDRLEVAREAVRQRWREEPNPTQLDPAIVERAIEAADGDDLTLAEQSLLAALRVGMAEVTGLETGHLDVARDAVAIAEKACAEVGASMDEPGVLDLDLAAVVAEAQLSLRRALTVHPDRVDEWTAASTSALRAAERARDPELLGRCQRLALADALADADRPRVLALTAGQPGDGSVATRQFEALWSAQLAALRGAYAEADVILAEAGAEVEALGGDGIALEYVKVAFALDRGGLAELVGPYEAILAVIANPTLRMITSVVAVLDGRERVATGHLEAALPDMVDRVTNPAWPVERVVTAEVAAALDHHSCQRLYDTYLSYAGRCITAATAPIPWLGAWDRVLGLLAIRLGRLDDAVTHLSESLRIHEMMEAIPWIARSHAGLALALGRRGRAGDREAAERHRTIAADLRRELRLTNLVWGDWGGATDEASEASVADRRGEDAGIFLVDGDSHVMGLAGSRHVVPTVRGFEHLGRLLAEPGREFHVLDLAADADGTGTRIDESDTGPRLDAQAKAAFAARHTELQVELDEAQQAADLGRAERLQDELDHLEQEVARAVGLGGRDRPWGGSAEKARVNVRRAIARAIKRIEAVDVALAAHLTAHVRTGMYCAYDPDLVHPVAWET